MVRESFIKHLIYIAVMLFMPLTVFSNDKSGSVKGTSHNENRGYRLPPEPDPKINNATLLGIDSNHNGVRDDVERWVYMTYNQSVERGIMLQYAYAYQKVIVDPSKAHETVRYMSDAQSCNFYLLDNIQFFKNKYEFSFVTEELKKEQFNTPNRYIAYERYNAEFDGEVFSFPPSSKEKCLFDENGNLKTDL